MEVWDAILSSCELLRLMYSCVFLKMTCVSISKSLERFCTKDFWVIELWLGCLILKKSECMVPRWSTSMGWVIVRLEINFFWVIGRLWSEENNCKAQEQVLCIKLLFQNGIVHFLPKMDIKHGIALNAWVETSNSC